MAIFEKGAAGKIITSVLIACICWLGVLVWTSNGRMISLEKDMQTQKEYISELKIGVVELNKQNLNVAKIYPMIRALGDKINSNKKTLDLLLRIALEQKRATYEDIDSSSGESLRLCIIDKEDKLF